MTKSVAWLFVSGLVVASTGACSVSVSAKTQTKYTYPDETRTASAAWAGQAIRVENDGVNPNINGNFQVVSDGTNTITATGSIVAYADDTDKQSADQTATEAIASFTITESSDTITIHCGHGSDHGSSHAGSSGCLGLVVHLPTGTSTQALNVTVNSGNGPVNVSGPIVGSLNVNSTGSGDVVAALTPAVGSDNQIIGGDAVTLAVPADFSADSVQMGSQADPPAIDTTAFPNLVNDSGYGTPGAGAKTIKVGSTGILSTDVAKLTKQ